MYKIYLLRFVVGKQPEVVTGIAPNHPTLKAAQIAARRELHARGAELRADGFRVNERKTGTPLDAFWRDHA